MATHGLAEMFGQTRNNVLHINYTDLDEATDLPMAIENAIFDFFPRGFDYAHVRSDNMVGPHVHDARLVFEYKNNTQSVVLDPRMQSGRDNFFALESLKDAHDGDTWQGPGRMNLHYVRAWHTVEGNIERQSYASAAALQDGTHQLVHRLFDEFRALCPGDIYNFSCEFTARTTEQDYTWHYARGHPNLERYVGGELVLFPQGFVRINPQRGESVSGGADVLLDEYNVGRGPFEVTSPLKVQLHSNITIAIHAVTTTGMVKFVNQPETSDASQVWVSTGLGGRGVMVDLEPGQTAGNVTEEGLFTTISDTLRAQGVPINKLAVGSGRVEGRMLRRSSHHLAFPKLACVFPKRPCLYLTFNDLKEATDFTTQLDTEIDALHVPPLSYWLSVLKLEKNGDSVIDLDLAQMNVHRATPSAPLLNLFKGAHIGDRWHGQAKFHAFSYFISGLDHTGSHRYASYSDIRRLVRETSMSIRREIAHLLGEVGTFTFTLKAHGQIAFYRWTCFPHENMIHITTIQDRCNKGVEKVSMDNETVQNLYDGPFWVESETTVTTNNWTVDLEIWAAPQNQDVYVLPPLSLLLDFVVVQHEDSEHQVLLYEGMTVGNVTSADLFWIVRHYFWVRGIALRSINVLPDHGVLHRHLQQVVFDA